MAKVNEPSFIVTLKKIEEEQKVALEKLKEIANPNAMGVSSLFAKFLKEGNSGHHTISWMIDEYWSLRTPNMIKQLNQIHSELTKRKHTEKNPFVFNDLDNLVWVERCKESKVVIHKSQSMNYVYIWSKGGEKLEFKGIGLNELHVRRFYDRFNDPKFNRTTDKFELEEDQEFKDLIAKEGRAAIINKASKYLNYADDENNPYPNRPSLEYFRKSKFKCCYGDSRDIGYIMTWKQISNRVDAAMFSHMHIQLMEEVDLPSIAEALFEKD